MNKIYLAIAEDDPIARDGLAMVVKNNPKYELVHKASNGKDLIDEIQQKKTLPDVILMDIDMPKINGFEACKEITNKYKEVGVIFLTAHFSRKHIENAILTGGNGYLSKSSSIEELFEAIEEVFTNGYYYNDLFDLDFVRHILQKGIVRHTFATDIRLTPREIEYIRLLCMEMTDIEIAKVMNISPLSTETYRKKLLKKVGVKKAIGLAIYATQKKLL